MHYRRLGHSGLKVSEISLGSWVTFGGQIDESTAITLMKEAFSQGINFFDNADMYAGGQAEIVMGKAIADLPREELVISSKVFWPMAKGPNGRGLSRKHIIEAINATLKRLDTDYVDLYFCHRFDPDSPMEEVVRAMSDLVHQGKILYWGTSEWDAAQVMQAFGTAREFGLIPPSRELGLGLTTFSPLYYGILSGKYNDGVPQGSRASLDDYGWIKERITPQRIEIVKALTDVALDMGITPAQLAIAWILRRKEVSTVITGATRLEQLDENLGASEAYEKMTELDIDRIFACLGNYQE
jgi:aryl-alcohol dehydrogenase-like predicted oxidoreductase